MRLPPGYSVPERITLLGLLAGLLATVFPVISSSTGLSIPCPMRTLTGIPCPGCGLTTGAVALVSGELGDAWSANPAVFGIAALVLVMAPVLALRLVGQISPPKPYSAATRRRIGVAALLATAASWAFQLHRFELW